MIWQNCQSVNEDASDFGRTACIWRSVPVIWQNYMVEEGGASPDLAEFLPVCGGVCQ